jgi:hypothetical protein
MVSLAIGLTVGALLGLRFVVWVLPPTMFMMATAIATVGVVSEQTGWLIGWTIVATCVALQIGYLGGGLTRRIFADGKTSEELLYRRAIQSKIGEELRAQFDLPQEMPHRILALLLQLGERDAEHRANWNAQFTKSAPV